MTGFEWFLVQLWISVTMALISYANRPKGKKPPRSTLDDIQIPTQAEGLSYPVVFGSPGVVKHSHVLFYGDLELTEMTHKDVTVGYKHWLTVCLGYCVSGVDGVKRFVYKDAVVWPTPRDQTAEAADGTTLAYIDAEEIFGGWRRDGGIKGYFDIQYGLADQGENIYLRRGAAAVYGTAELILIVSHDGAWVYAIRSATFATQADGYWTGGTFSMAGISAAVIDHEGSWIYLNGGDWWHWLGNSRRFRIVPPATNLRHQPGYRGIVTVVARHAYWGITPVLGILGAEWTRTQKLCTGAAQWYVAKALIGAERDLNAIHMLREIYTDPVWGEGHAAADLGDSWTAAADTIYTEGLGLSCLYSPEPGNNADFEKQILGTIGGYTYEDRTTGKIEVGLLRELSAAALAALPEYDESDFEVLDWHDEAPWEATSRVLVGYSNRVQAENAKTTTPYDDLGLQARQGGRIIEQKFDLPLIYDDTVAENVKNRLGREHCRLKSLGTLRAKRTMADLHQGSAFLFSYDDADLTVVQLVVRVGRLHFGRLGEDALEIDVVKDLWSDAYAVYGAPEPPTWEQPPVEPNETPIVTGVLEARAAVSGTDGLGTAGAMTAAGGVSGTCSNPAPSSSPSTSPSA